MSCFIAYISSFLNMKPKEAKAYYKIKKLLNKDNKENKTADIIKYVLYMKKYSKKPDKKLIEKSCISILLYTRIKLFNNKNYLSTSYAMPVNDLLLMIGKNIQSNWDELNEIIFNKGNVEDDILFCIKNTKDCSSHIAKILSMQTRMKNYLLKRMNAKFKETHQVVYHSSNVLLHVSPNKSKRGSGLTFGKRKKISKMKEDLEESKFNCKYKIKKEYQFSK